MKRKILIALLVLLLAGIGYGTYYIAQLGPIISGYAAKNLASDVFLGHRSQKSVEAIDLNFSFIKYTRNTVDFRKKEVVSRFLWFSSKAIYVDGFGCILLRDSSEQSLRSLSKYKIKPASLQIPTDNIPWPEGDKVSDTIPSGINILKMNRVLEDVVAGKNGYKGTFAVAVAYKGALVAEKYAPGFSAGNRFLSWSMAKSFTNALTAIMVKKGLLDIYKPADIPEWKNDKRNCVTINNLLHMNSGLEWNEDYGNLSDVTLMLHEQSDMARYTYEHPMQCRPDSLWKYSSGTTNIVSYLIRKKLGKEAYLQFPEKELFSKINMRSAVFEIDETGTFTGSSYLYASLRDYVRFGLLYLNNGNWIGQQLFPSDWVRYTVTPARGSGGRYGAFFWLNASSDFPKAPKDMFLCRGHDGQFIFIIPSLQLVVVRTGCSKKGEFDENKFITSVISSIIK